MAQRLIKDGKEYSRPDNRIKERLHGRRKANSNSM